MRVQELQGHLVEEGTGYAKVTFKNELGQLVTPDSVFIHVTDLSGTPIVYARELADRNSTMYIELSGSDLIVRSTEVGEAERLLIVYGNMDFAAGNNKPYKRVYKFKIQAIDIVAGDIDIAIVDHVFTGEMIN